MDKIKPYLKAVVGFVAPAAVTIGAAVTSSSDGGTRITQTEWITALVACVVTSAGVCTRTRFACRQRRRTSSSG
jgi:hypothetical protein